MLQTEARALAADQLPDLVGPYRLGERLGAGGMGEVYRGYDSRLDRSVALKRVRPGVGDPETALRRFRREARAVARLRHPSIVQVFDWVETEEDAWLVMEMVEGQSLRDLLHGGPLDPSRVADFARELLEGLAKAHEFGLVHRDLKASNVMISVNSSSSRGRGEQAQILDFGLAKTHVEEESQLSVDGKIIGTLSAMAPEQVLGQAVDGRTDLFALGCLLYEALTGSHPFFGKNVGETLHRICNVRQIAVKERRPEVSESLSSFVDALLQKDPRRRPISAAAALDELERVSEGSGILGTLESENSGDDGLQTEVDEGPQVVGLGLGAPESPDEQEPPDEQELRVGARRAALVLGAILGAAGLVLTALIGRLAMQTNAEPVYVAVPETKVTIGGKRSVELGARAIHTALLQGLIDRQGVIALEVPAGAATDRQALALELAADEVLSSELDCDERGCRALLRRVGSDGRVLWAQAFTAKPKRLLDLSEAVLGHLASAYPHAKPRSGATNLEVQPADFESFLSLHQRFQSRGQGFSGEQLLDELDRLSTTSPRFVAIPLLTAHVALQLFQGSRAPQDVERATAALERARSLAPQDPRVLMLAARVARQAGDLDAAEELIEQVRHLEPGHAEADFQLALLQEQRGDGAVAVALAREVAHRRPSAYLLFHSADLLSRQGDFIGAREFIERGLERSPERFDGVSRLAQLELAHGDLERAAQLYQRLVERSPEETELVNLGTALMMLGRLAEAKDCFVQVVEQNPSSPFATLNLADVTKLMKDLEAAAVLYERVLELAAAPPDFGVADPLASVRAQAQAHLGRKEAAVESIQAAIRQRPEHPWIAFEAALVHTLIDDRASALWNARRALDGGIEPRWFSLAWFDPIRKAIDSGKP